MTRFSKPTLYKAGAVAAMVLLAAVLLSESEPPPMPDASELPVGQVIQEANRDGAVIIVNLTPKKRIYLQGVDLCPKDGILSSEAADISRVCPGGASCITVIDFQDRPIPAEIIINRLYNGACMRQPVPTARFIQTALYQSEIVIPASLGKRMRLSGDTEWTPARTEKSLFQEFDAQGRADNGKFTLRYGKAVTEDEFKLDDKLIKVTYADSAAMAKPSAP